MTTFPDPLPNKRLKLAARVDCGMSFSSARRSLSAIRYSLGIPKPYTVLKALP